MQGPDTPEAVALAIREGTASLRADPLLGVRAIEVARRRAELERPALVVLAFAASLSLWLSLQGDASPSFESLDESLDAAEASL